MAWNGFTERFTANGYLSIDDIAVFNENLLYIRDLMESCGLHSSEYFYIDTKEDYQTQPFPEYLNKIERNIDNVYSGITWEQHKEPTRTWLGEYDDIPTFSYVDVNRWYDSLSALKPILEAIPENYRICGTFSSGEYATQRFRR